MKCKYWKTPENDFCTGCSCMGDIPDREPNGVDNVEAIIIHYLKSVGCDGLCNIDYECGCGIEDGLFPCESVSTDCQPAKRLRCESCGEKETCGYYEERKANGCFHSLPVPSDGGDGIDDAAIMARPVDHAAIDSLIDAVDEAIQDGTIQLPEEGKR